MLDVYRTFVYGNPGKAKGGIEGPKKHICNINCEAIVKSIIVCEGFFSCLGEKSHGKVSFSAFHFILYEDRQQRFNDQLSTARSIITFIWRYFSSQTAKIL
jgi:hypothetical protein